MHMRKFLLLPVVALLMQLPAMAAKKKVLFIGNSYTYTNNMPLILQSLAASLGDTLVYDESDPGGYSMMQHTTYAPTITKIFAQQWDLVVIQDQSQMPAFPPAQVLTDVYPYAARLDSMVHANDTCTQTMFMMTWGHANGDPANCAGYPAICTYDGMQQRLRESYMDIGVNNHAAVAPVGMAFKIMMDSAYAPWLYIADSSHPLVPGSYIEACVLYGSIFHKHTLGSIYLSGLTATDAHMLQRVADKVVFDSMALWQQNGHYPYAGFTHTAAGSTVTFTSTHTVPVASGTWSFGDMATDTATNPVHMYATAGSYTVSHTVSNSCFTETLTDTVHIGTVTNVSDLNGTHAGAIIAQGNGAIKLALQLHDNDRLEITDMKGVLVRTYTAQTLPATDNLMPGLYVYRLYNTVDKGLSVGKVSVY